MWGSLMLAPIRVILRLQLTLTGKHVGLVSSHKFSIDFLDTCADTVRHQIAHTMSCTQKHKQNKDNHNRKDQPSLLKVRQYFEIVCFP